MEANMMHEIQHSIMQYVKYVMQHWRQVFGLKGGDMIGVLLSTCFYEHF